MKQVILSLFLAAAAFPATAQEFGRLFDDFVKEAKEEQARFRDEANKRFADLLSESWTEFRVLAGMEYPKKPKPRTAPIAQMELPEQQVPELPENPVPATPETLPKTSPSEEHAIPESDNAELPGMYACTYDFYGCQVKIQVPDKIASYRMTGNSEKDIARFWKEISNSEYTEVIGLLAGYAEEVGLEGWSLYLLVENFSKSLFGPERNDEMEVFKTFILNQMGLDIRMGLADGRLSTMVCVKEPVYARLSCEFDGRKYYFSSDIRNVTKLLSYSGNFSDNLSPVSVEISKQMHLGSEESISVIKKSSRVFGTNISLPVNTSLCNFYLDYPQVDVNIYASAAYDEAFTSALTNALKPFLQGKDELTQVNELLKFLQFDFKYSADDDQFGYEKPFFIEENFIYRANDCEDRSILFSFLVRKLLGIDVVLLDYPGHIATAICFNADVPGDSFLYNGRRFTICDPTYIGAPAGMAMPDCRDAEFKVLEL